MEKTDKNISLPLIQTKSLIKTYGKGEGEVKALDDVSITVNRGELLVILGSSGCGKSTLLNMIGCMDTPTSGSVIIEGKDISKLSSKELTIYRRDKIGFIFQSFNLLTDLTAKENVLLAAGLSDTKEDADKALELVGLKKHKNHYPSQLSGGQQQRVAIARALVKNADFFLCDEPTGALDYTTSKQIISVLENLSKKKGKTVIIVTHTGAFGKIADRVIEMRSGKVLKETINDKPLTAEQIEW